MIEVAGRTWESRYELDMRGGPDGWFTVFMAACGKGAESNHPAHTAREAFVKHFESGAPAGDPSNESERFVLDCLKRLLVLLSDEAALREALRSWPLYVRTRSLTTRLTDSLLPTQALPLPLVMTGELVYRWAYDMDGGGASLSVSLADDNRAFIQAFRNALDGLR